MKRILYFSLIITFSLLACRSGSGRLNIDISRIPDPGLEIKRYGKDLFEMDPQNIGQELPELALQYPVFLGALPLDTLSYIQIYDFVTDPFLGEIAMACAENYPDLKNIEEQLNSAWRHYLYYYPDAVSPEAYSYISGLDFEYPVQMHDGILLISLDMYLGKDYEPYGMSRIPQYRTKRATRDYLVRDIMLELAGNLPTAYKAENILLDQMIEKGKMLYFLDATMPGLHDTVKISYTAPQLDWCQANERNLWAFIIENELLFSSDYEKTHKLIIDAPFTSFFPDGSPGRTGWWTGWQIVRSFMDNNSTVGIPQLMQELSPRQILDNSSYNP
ncbi:MAG: hypothetical protein ABFS05_05775 [Bacteroidota bacterium]